LIHSQNTQAPREELTAAIIDAKMRKDLSWQELTDGTGLSLVFVTAALLGQHPLPETAAEIVVERLGLGKDAAMPFRCAAASPAVSRPTPPFTGFTK
jgi:cyanate lyase